MFIVINDTKELNFSDNSIKVNFDRHAGNQQYLVALYLISYNVFLCAIKFSIDGVF